VTDRVRRWPVIVLSALGFFTLVALGSWQLARLQYKEALIADVEHRMLAAPVDGEAQLLSADEKNYTKVVLQGRYIAPKTLFKLTTYQGGPGLQVITPFLTSANTLVLVDRGTIGETRRDAVRTPEGQVTITGLLRSYRGTKGIFDPDNNPTKGQWYWWDLKAMLAAASVSATATSEHYVLQLLPDPALPSEPAPAKPKAEFRNNHMGYAITWFGLSATLLAVSAAFLRRRTH
jgi:surfeit locus 1 family protein